MSESQMIQAPGWGYMLPQAAATSGMISLEDFHTMTANKYLGDEDRLPAIIESASMAIRNYCGWHLYPSAECLYKDRILYGNGRAKMVGRDLMVQLPAAHVSEILKVEIGGREYTDYAAEANGMLHVFDIPGHAISRKTEIAINYMAGVPEGAMPNIQELVANKAIRGITGTAGVMSESAGGVSISYANAWANGGGAGALSPLDADTLAPYKLGGVF